MPIEISLPQLFLKALSIFDQHCLCIGPLEKKLMFPDNLDCINLLNPLAMLEI